MSQQVWKVWFHPRDRHSHCGYGQCMEGTRADVEAAAREKAGRTYTVTLKQVKVRKPLVPYKRHKARRTGAGPYAD